MTTLSPKLTPTCIGLRVEYPGRESWFMVTNKEKGGFPATDENPCALTYYDFKGDEVYSIWAGTIYDALALANIIANYNLIVVDTGGGCKAMSNSGYGFGNGWYFLLTALDDASLPVNAEPTRLYYYDETDREITHIDGLPAEKALYHIRDFIDLLAGRLT